MHSEACRVYCFVADEHAHGDLVACLDSASLVPRTSYFWVWPMVGLLCKMCLVGSLGPVYMCAHAMRMPPFVVAWH